MQSSNSIVEMRKLVGDLFEHRASLYWLDLMACLVVGYGSATVYLQAPGFSILQIVALVVASFAMFRVGSFIHEITHLRSEQMRYFTVGWNLLCGIPMMMPSFFYTNHIDHHKTDRYGTVHDGEYVPLGSLPVHHIWMFLSQMFFIPIYVFVRFIISPLTFVNPRVRTWFLEHYSSFVMNFKHRLIIPASAPRKVWALTELACFVRAAGMLAVVAFGLFDWTRILGMYVLAVCILALNYNRNLVAHHYRNRGRKMSHLEQLEDSVNITGTPLLTELFFPLGLRYHALHHLFPALPYHSLPKAHRRLVTTLPPDSPYHTTVFPTYWSVLRELFADARAAESNSEAVAA